jgi:hypothetical protein
VTVMVEPEESCDAIPWVEQIVIEARITSGA